MAKTTKAQFKIFEKEVAKWVDRFHLGSWEIHCEHKEMDIFIASCAADLNGKVATLGLAVNFGESTINTYEIKKCAFHEVIELLLHEYCCITISRDYNKEEHERAVHTVIRTLEHGIFDKEYTSR